MRNILFGLLILSNSSFAEELKDKNKIASILTRYPDLSNQVLAKSLTAGKLIQVDKIITEDTGNVWDEDGASFDCKLKLTAFSDNALVGQVSRIYTDRDCPRD